MDLWQRAWSDWAPSPRSRCSPGPGRSRRRAAHRPPRDRRARLRHAGAHRRGREARRWTRATRTTCPAPGLPELREAVARVPRADRAARRRRPSACIVTPGAKPIMFFAILALCERGRRGPLPRPRVPDVRVDRARSSARRRCRCPLREENEFRLDPDELASLVTDRTKLLVLNSPHNPCGSALTREDVEAIAAIALGTTSSSSPTRSTGRSATTATARERRDVAGHGRADDPARRLVEDVRDDRLAARIRRLPAASWSSRSRA